MKRFVVAIACAAVLGSSAGCGRGERASTGLVKVGDHSWAVVASGPTFAEGLGANSGFVVGRDGDDLLIRNYEGHTYRYPDPVM